MLLLALPSIAQAQFTFTTNNGTITITGYTGPGGDVTIPDSTNGYPVTAIGNDAFLNCTTITSISIPYSVTNIASRPFGSCTSLTAISVDASNLFYTSAGGVLFDSSQSLLIAYPGGRAGAYTIPDSVTSIEGDAFYCCFTLSGISIPTGVTNIGANAFYYDSALTSVTIPSSVVSIGSGAFALCQALSAITVDPENPVYSSTNGVLFDVSQTTVIQYPAGITSWSYTIPQGVTNVGYDAFFGCVKLASVTIPNTVTTIGGSAFGMCLGLTNIWLPNSVTSIGNQAFYGCTGLHNVIIPSSVASIGFDGFALCQSLIGAYFEGNAPANPDGTAFFLDSNMKVYYLPGTTGWSSTFGSRPTALWFLPKPIILSNPNFGVQTNAFGFVVSWATNLSLVVEACTNLANSTWSPVSTNVLTNGCFCFSDPNWTNNASCLYRIRSP